MTTQRELDKFLNGKLSFINEGGTSHDQYVLYVYGDTSKIVNLPTKPTVPRHPGDLSKTVLKKTAAALGLSMKLLQVGSECGLSAECIWLCLAGHVLATGLRLFDTDRVVFTHLPARTDASASNVLDRATGGSSKWNKNESQALEAAKRQFIDPFMQHADLVPAMKRWLAMAKLG